MTIVDKATTRNLIIRASRQIFRAIEWATRGKVQISYDKRTTTIGRTMYAGSNFRQRYDKEAQEREVAHEAVHVQQYERLRGIYYAAYILNLWTVALSACAVLAGWSWYAWLIGAVLSLFLPAGLSLRAYFERQAFRIGLMVLKSQNLDIKSSRQYLAWWHTQLLTGEQYYYAAWLIKPMVRRSWERWLESNKIGRG